MITLFLVTTVVFVIAYLFFEISIAILWEALKLLIIIFIIKTVIDLFRKGNN